MPTDDEGAQRPGETVRQIQERLAAASLNPVEGTLREILAIVKRLEVEVGEIKRLLVPVTAPESAVPQ